MYSEDKVRSCGHLDQGFCKDFGKWCFSIKECECKGGVSNNLIKIKKENENLPKDLPYQSGHKNINWCKNHKKWVVQKIIKNVKHDGGRYDFDDLKSAVAAKRKLYRKLGLKYE
jgi:hypothetical protein